MAKGQPQKDIFKCLEDLFEEGGGGGGGGGLGGITFKKTTFVLVLARLSLIIVKYSVNLRK